MPDLPEGFDLEAQGDDFYRYYITLALEQKADQIRDLLGATRTEMLRMDEVLERLRVASVEQSRFQP